MPRLAAFALLAVLVAPAALRAATPPMPPPVPAAGFESPEAAGAALLSALLSAEPWKLAAVVGSSGVALFASGDKAVDQEQARRFIEAYADRHHIAQAGEDRATLVIGPKDWPLPIPLVHDAAGWHFDAAAGSRQVADRRIGRNELGAIRGLLALATAQRAYHDAPDGPHAYALKLVSAHGQHDGLFWPDAANQPRSPLAGVANLARADGYALSPAELPGAYGGYRLRLLTAAGENAPGGARSFLDGKRRLTGGFAYLAWPQHYGTTGVMTFLLGPDGTVFQKDLGTDTDAAVAMMKTYDPDLGWTLVDIGGWRGARENPAPDPATPPQATAAAADNSH